MLSSSIIFTVMFISAAAAAASSGTRNETKGLSCYQCVRHTEELCTPQDLRPCPKISDRCVTHIQKDENTGFTIKRECGLGPCQFDDEMVQKGLGLDRCDRTRKQYFCVHCCNESGCNGVPDTHSNLQLNLYLLTFITSTLLQQLL
ncbi:hypothetical protein LSTR_LSTR000404 [Laodelphax striatellus]|uniref:UPAR/Ly6 domain-containing protein n=1 Tax=Laodelphax striatellus TaxID=195883 RepID=A0A482X3N6_LAOST|nr:hypothetical protein LSTR_LSTR000404 [Laodelphax striatellus]